MSLFDGWGETLGGITDAITDGAEQYVGGWFDNETNKVVSAAPEENRETDPQAVQPNGQPVGYIMPPFSQNWPLYIGGGLLALVAAKVLTK